MLFETHFLTVTEEVFAEMREHEMLDPIAFTNNPQFQRFHKTPIFGVTEVVSGRNCIRVCTKQATLVATFEGMK